MSIDDETRAVRSRLAKRIRALVGDREVLETAIPGLTLNRRTRPLPPTSHIYEPSLAMIVRGQKFVHLGGSSYGYDESRFVLTAVNLPTMTEVREASAKKPYYSLIVRLDLRAASEIMAEIGPASGIEPTGLAIATGPAAEPLLESVARLVALLETPADIPVLGPLLHRELLYRLLKSPAGGRLAQIVRIGTRSQRVAKAVTWLRTNYDAPLKLETLAKHCGMGVSTLHHHFRRMTSMSPLQFQKQLRLHEARRLLLASDLDAGSVAYRIGYQSATQFNREYRRLFGAPPMRDVKALRG